MKGYITAPLTTTCYGHLAALAFLFYGPIRNISSFFTLPNVFFLGYSQNQAGYKCLHPSGIIYVSHHVEFNPSEFPFLQLFSASSSSSSQSSSWGHSTTFLHPIVSSSSSLFCPRVAQSVSSRLPNPPSVPSSSTSLSDTSPTSGVPVPIAQPVASKPKPVKPIPAPSVHPMLTRL